MTSQLSTKAAIRADRKKSPQRLVHEGRKADKIKIGNVVFMERPGRQCSPSPARANFRLREIERIIEHRYGDMIPETDDADLLIIPAAYAINVKSLEKGIDFLKAFQDWCGEWCPWVFKDGNILGSAQAKVKNFKHDMKACTVARIMAVTYEERTHLGLKTVGACDMTDDELKMAARQRKRDMERARIAMKRREAGIEPVDHTKSAEHTKPWLAEGISRRTWYRRQKASSDQFGTPALEITNTNPLYITSNAAVPTSSSKAGSHADSKGADVQSVTSSSGQTNHINTGSPVQDSAVSTVPGKPVAPLMAKDFPRKAWRQLVYDGYKRRVDLDQKNDTLGVDIGRPSAQSGDAKKLTQGKS